MDLNKMIEDSEGQRKEALTQVRDFYLENVAGPHLQFGPTPQVCAEIQLGKKPSEIAPQLTRKEAAAWAYQTKYETPEEWLWAQIVEEYPKLSQSHTSNIEVMRWCQRMLASDSRREAMFANRVVFGEVEADASSIAQRLDEIAPQDLTDSPAETLQNAVNRNMREMWDGPDELLPHEPWMDRLPKGCRVIRTWPELFREGSEMRHCVAQYAESVADRSSVIVSIVTEHGRSTAEFKRGRLVQHQGLARSEVHESCARAARAIEESGAIP